MKTISPRSDRRVSFVQDRATFHDFAAGNTDLTKNPLDVAIDGRDFSSVQTPAGERYTRDGSLQINNQGQLVTAGGNPVLGTSGPIVFQPTDKEITSPPTATSPCSKAPAGSTRFAASCGWSRSRTPKSS